MLEIRPFLLNGALKSSDLLDAAGVTRETLANAYRRESATVLRFGRARATRYAAREVLPGLQEDEFPVFRIDSDGRIHRAGTLVTLAATQSVWLPGTEVVDGLPPELHDAAPKGFLGRSYSRHHHDLGLPEDVSNWSDNHVLVALSRRGEDLPGNLVIGRESFDRFQDLQHKPRTTADFAALSERAIAGEHVGSSAGGEQPKFTALIDGRHCIVKFATSATDNARRWRDLLALEHIALQTLRAANIAAAETELVDIDDRRYLVVDRFDRIGEAGRRAVLTLAAASGNVEGSWTDSAEKMHKRAELSDDSLARVALLDAFGAQIANSDRHHYNVSLFPVDDRFEVAPAFDQLPMAYSPPASGNLRNTAIDEPRPEVNTLDVWEDARELASEFWRRARELDLTESMRAIVDEHARRA